MKYDFTSVPDRSKCGSMKWNGHKNSSVENVPLSVADMEFPTAPPIVDAIKNLADTTILGYTQPTDVYYDAVSSWMKRRHNFDVKKEWIINTPGVVDALAVLIDAVTKPGDGVIVITPVYYPFDMAVIAKGRKIIYTTLINNNGHYEIDYTDLETKAKTKSTKALLFCNPHNPVGRVWTKEELKKVCDICCDNNVFIIDDEIHHDLIMSGYEHTVMANANSRVIENIAVCTAPSKTFNIAGLQGSNIIIPNAKTRTKAIACSMLNMHTSLNIFAYTACTAAYNECEEWLEELLTVIEGNAKYVEEFMVENFPEIKTIPLEGTYLQWLDMRDLGMTHIEQKKMLENAGIYLDNGEVFGESGRGYQRINLACARETLEKTMQRFKNAVDAVRKSWEKDGAPYHKTLTVGTKLEKFTYTDINGSEINLEKTIKGNTLIVFSRYYECEICRAILAMLTAAYPLLKIKGYDVKVVLQSDISTISKASEKYPFELIADSDKILYDQYNVFEADGFVQMLAGDKLYHTFVGKNVKKLLNTSLVDSVATAFDSNDEAETDDGPRQLQLNAFVAVDSNMNVTYSHYCKTIADFPSAKELIKNL
ncbi:MAG: PatB family C-S lyase [Eubacterium sp.]